MSELTLEHVLKMLEDVYASAGDNEAAHGLEDRMHQTVLRAIADGKCEEPREAARIALKSQEISFARWCA
jgi:hypothetical protein